MIQFFSLFLVILIKLHPVHVSMVNVELSKNNNSLEITAKFFKDDFQAIVYQKSGYVIDIQSPQLNMQEKIAVSAYLNQHLGFNWQSSEILDIHITKKKLDDLSVWYFLKIPIKQSKGSLEIRNSLLLDLYHDQTNLVIFTARGKEVSFIFNRKNTQTNLAVK